MSNSNGPGSLQAAAVNRMSELGRVCRRAEVRRPAISNYSAEMQSVIQTSAFWRLLIILRNGKNFRLRLQILLEVTSYCVVGVISDLRLDWMALSGHDE